MLPTHEFERWEDKEKEGMKDRKLYIRKEERKEG
jgi:hypothetical protein